MVIRKFIVFIIFLINAILFFMVRRYWYIYAFIVGGIAGLIFLGENANNKEGIILSLAYLIGISAFGWIVLPYFILDRLFWSKKND